MEKKQLNNILNDWFNKSECSRSDFAKLKLKLDLGNFKYLQRRADIEEFDF